NPASPSFPPLLHGHPHDVQPAPSYTSAMRILALDIGSSAVKAGFWDGTTFASHGRTPYPTRFTGARVEINAATLLKAITTSARSALAGVSSIDAISYCIFSSGVVITDPKGKPLTPVITHADRRSSQTALAL